MSTTTNITGLTIGEDILITLTVAGSGSIAAWTFEFNLRDQKTDAIVVTKTVGAGITITDAANRVLTIALNDTDTEPLRADQYLWDAWRTNDGSETCLADGTMDLKRTARNG